MIRPFDFSKISTRCAAAGLSACDLFVYRFDQRERHRVAGKSNVECLALPC